MVEDMRSRFGLCGIGTKLRASSWNGIIYCRLFGRTRRRIPGTECIGRRRRRVRSLFVALLDVSQANLYHPLPPRLLSFSLLDFPIPSISSSLDRFPIGNDNLQRAELPRCVQQQGSGAQVREQRDEHPAV